MSAKPDNFEPPRRSQVIGVTVREALASEALRGVKVLAGRSKLGNRITGINIIEVPEVTRWLKGGELLFTAMFAVKDGPQAQVRLVRGLANKRVAALAVKPGQYVKEVPATLVAEAQAVGLPLLELPPDVPYMDVAGPVLDMITESRLRSVQAAESIRGQLLELLMTYPSLEPFCASLSEIVRLPVAILDDDCRFLASASPVGEHEGGWTAEIAEVLQLAAAARSQSRARDAFDTASHPLGEERSATLVPIIVDARFSGYLCLLGKGPPIDSYESLVLEQAARALRLEFARERVQVGKSHQLQDSLLEELIIGAPRTSELSNQKARMLNMDLRDNYVSLVVRISGLVDSNFVLALERRLQQACRATFADQNQLIISRLDPEHLVGIVNCRTGRLSNLLLASLSRAVDELSGRFPKADILLGVSRIWRGSESFRRAYEEAMRVVQLHGSIVTARVASYARLGVYQLLNELIGSPALLEFYDQTIAPLIDYDKEHNRELSSTAEAFFASGMNLSKTARALHLHRNTLVYRLRRIEEISGHSLDDPEDSFELHLALRIRHLLSWNKGNDDGTGYLRGGRPEWPPA